TSSRDYPVPHSFPTRRSSDLNCRHLVIQRTTVLRLTPFLVATAWSFRPATESNRMEARITLRCSPRRERCRFRKRSISSSEKKSGFRRFVKGMTPPFGRSMPGSSSIVYLLKELQSRRNLRRLVPLELD